MGKFYFIAIGGAVGALLRYLVSGTVYKYFRGVFPWGTLSVNIIGAFSIGLLADLFERTIVPPNMKMFVFIGLLGAFTTFSTFNLESFYLFRDGEVKFAILNILINNICCIVLVFAGFFISKYLINLFK